MAPVTTASAGTDGYWSANQVNVRFAETSRQPVEAVCPVCAGLGWVKADARPGAPEFGKLQQCPTCSEPARQRWLAQNCGLEGAALDARLSSHWRGGDWPDVDEQEREARTRQRRAAWKAITTAFTKRVGLFTFWGDFGSGKSHALAIIVNECRACLIEAYYTPLAAILSHLRSLYSTRQDTSTYWQRLLDVPVLALDEVTRFNATPWAQEMLFVLADTRYRRRRSHLTVFSTNDDPRQSLPTSEALGYLYSRMREGARDGGLVELRGDMRPAVKAEWWQ